jgi:hypothetical protein
MRKPKAHTTYMLKPLVTLSNILGVAQLQHELVEGLGY